MNLATTGLLAFLCAFVVLISLSLGNWEGAIHGGIGLFFGVVALAFHKDI